MSEILRLPVYPSTEVLFPGQLLPLYPDGAVYDHVLRVCYQRRYPIGVVFVEQPGGFRLSRVGTLAYPIGQVFQEEYIQEGMWGVGQSRFQIIQLHHDHAYLEATVSIWPWLASPEPLWQTIEEIGVYLRRYISALVETLPPMVMPEMLLPQTVTLGVLGASLLQISPAEKQRLLEIPTARGLLEAVLKYMQVYVPVAERLLTIAPSIDKEYGNVSLN
ncbi:MAG: LON peptidase substrate-binding domain-containing protein [Anaerolineae bacterium]|nr:LON peptidase substrate-binding domain-containing protein [Anaerolineae bacterium]